MQNNDRNLWIVPYNNQNKIVEYKPQNITLPKEGKIVAASKEMKVIPFTETSKAKKWFITACKIACAALIIGGFAAASVFTFGAAAAAGAGMAYLLTGAGVLCLASIKALVKAGLQHNMYRFTDDNAGDVLSFLSGGAERVAHISDDIISKRIAKILDGADPFKEKSLRERILDVAREMLRGNAVEA
jgi:hypothetical protein